MFKKKNKNVEEQSKVTNTKSATVNTVETKQSVTTIHEVRTTNQYSFSSTQVRTSNFGSSQSVNQSSLATTSKALGGTDLKTDAVKFTPNLPKSPINKNYVSPYRTANTTSAFLSSTISTNVPSTHLNSTETNFSSTNFRPTRTNATPNSYGSNGNLKPISSTNYRITDATPLRNPSYGGVQITPSSNNTTSGIPTYDTTSKKRGKVLIINNIKFPGNEERKGAQFDEKSLKSKKAMESEIKKFANDKSLKNFNMSILIIMSHGTRMGQTMVTQIAGVDGQSIVVDDILGYFSDTNCSHLLGKPKIFIFQCCRGDNEQEIHTDAVPFNRNSDMLIAYSTIPGFVSYRDPNNGSWYIQILCKIFEKHAHEWDIETMLKKVDVEMSQLSSNRQQVSSYESRGFKRCFLFSN